MSQYLCAEVTNPRARRGLEEAFAILRSQEAAGDRPVGWKITVTSPTYQKRLGLKGPLVGPLVESRIWRNETTQRLGPGLHFVEVELALKLGQEVPAQSSLTQCAAAIAQIAPAIEMLAVDGPFDDVQVILARNTYHAGVLFGHWQPAPAAFRTGDLSFDLQVGGTVVGHLEPSLIVGEPAQIVQFTADLLAHFGQRLEAGQQIICGALNPPTQVQCPAHIETTLAPVGRIGLHVDRAASRGK